MIKPLATMMFFLGLLLTLITGFNYLNSPLNIDYNGAVDYSMSDSGMSIAFFFGLIFMIGGFALLRLSKVPRRV